MIGNTSVVGQPQQTQSRKSSSDSLDSSDASHHQQIVKVLASPPSSSSSVYPPPLPPPPLTQPVLLRSPTSSSHHQQPQQYQRFNQHPHPYHPAPPPPQVVTVCRAAPVVSATKSTTASVSSSTIQEVSQSPSAPLSPPIRLTPTSSSYPNPPRHGNDVDILDSLLSLSRKLLLPYDAANQLTSHDEGHSVLSSNDRSKLPLLVPHYSRNDKNYCKRRQYRHPIGIASLPPVHVYFNGSSSLSATRSVVGQFGIPEAFRKSSTNISEISASIFSVPPSLMPEMEIGLSWLHFMRLVNYLKMSEFEVFF